MKKILFAAFALSAAFAAGAQTDVVKAADRALKEGKDAAEVVTLITPAFTDPETAGQAQTWFIPGKASFAEYDKLLGLKQFNRLPEGGDAKMGHLLIGGYDYFVKALPLDSVANEKGKVKTKYSKDIVNTIAGHFADYSSAGADLYNAQDYDGAYRAWEIFTSIPSIPAFADKIAQFADSVYGEIYYNQAIAAWQNEKLPEALQAFMNAKNKGYNKKALYDYAIAVASGSNNDEAVLTLAQEALPLYGNEDDMYIRQIINHYLQARDFENAFAIINRAIGEQPENAQFLVIRGVLYENNDQKDLATEDYRKAVKLDADNADALFNLGRMLCDKAFTAADAAPTTEAEYIPFAEENILPYFREAAEILERAYGINPENPSNRDILNYLENVYYNLHDENNLKDVQRRKAYE